MKQRKSPISGQEITQEELLKGLPPKHAWKQFSERVYAKFRAKPATKKSYLSSLKTIIKENMTTGIRKSTKSHPAYASTGARKPSKRKKTPKPKTRSWSRRSG